MSHLLNRRLQVWRQAGDGAGDGMGGRSTSRLQVGQVRARVAYPSAREQTEAGQASASLQHLIHVAPRADVARGDWLRDTDTGETWRIDVVRHPSPRPVDLVRIEAELLQGEVVD